MTVSSTTTKNSYSGNGSTTEFAYGFKIFDDDDITVIIRTDATGAETTKTKTTHYTVSGVGSASGGNVTFTSGNIPTSAQTVVLIRDTARTQLTDYVANDPFPAESHEDALDKLTLITQELEEELGRSLKLSRTNTMTSTEFTVGATDRANKVLSFDASGEISVTQEIGTFKGNWAASTSYAVRDLVKDTSTNNIFLAKTAHTSSGSQPLTTNTDSAKWDLIVDAASATTSATAAASSATAAASSASTASTQASNASTSASTASTQATNAANSATASASSATAASNAQAAAEAALDTFDDRFLGAKSSDPSVDNDGNALIDGALYFDTTNDIMKVYDLTNTQWRQLTLTSTNQTNVNHVAGQISPTNNIATVATGINSGTFSGATTFAETYRVSANAPTTSLDVGDLWFDTTNNLMKVYGASGFINAGSSVNGTANRFAWTVGTSSGSYDGSLTVFPATYDAGFVDVFLNGVKLLVGTDVTATNGTSVTLASAAVAADIVEIVAYGTFTAATELSLLDNKKIQLGSSQDLQLFHDGTDSHINVTGALTVDVSGDINLDAGGGEIYFQDDGATIAYFSNSSTDFILGVANQDKDFYIQGNDGGSTINALQIDMSAAGLATFNAGASFSGNVGIGTASPAATLESKITTSGAPATSGTTPANVALRLASTATTGLIDMGLNGSAPFIQATDSGDLSQKYNLALNPNGGNVGIGGTPSYPLHVQSGSNSAVARITNTSSANANVNSILQLATASNVSQHLVNELNNYSQFSHSGDLTFHYDDVDTHVFRTKAGSEKMRINSSNLLVGVSSTTSAGKIKIETNDEWTIGSDVNNGTTAKGHIAFYNPNGLVGYISTNGTSTAYNTSSDYRLKENVTATWDATTRLKQLNPVRFNFIADADTTVDGFLAHEVSHDSDGNPLVPEAIVGEKDAMRDEEYEVSAATGDIYTPATDDADEVIHSANVENPDTLEEGQQWRETTAAVMGTRSVPDYQGIDQSKLVPLLVKTIQELEARITALEAE